MTVTVDKKDAESLNREPRKYVSAILCEGDTRYDDVAIHLRGSVGSFQHFNDKPGLTLNMDKSADDQRYNGMDKLHLANSVQDPSYLSELICGELFRAAGVPAARVGHATVTLNGRKRGLYYVKEGYDKQFLREHGGERQGHRESSACPRCSCKPSSRHGFIVRAPCTRSWEFSPRGFVIAPWDRSPS